MSLDTFQVEFNVKDTPNVDGVPVNVEAVANLRISSDPSTLASAVSQLLGKTPQQIMEICRNTLEGQLRQIVGTLTIEDMVKNREKLSQEVLGVAKTELEKTGIDLVIFTIKGVNDTVGYIEALGKKRTAEVQRDAAIGEAEAQREALEKSSTAIRTGQEKKLENDQAVAEAQRNLAVKQAELKVETDTALAKAELAGALARADIQKDLKVREAAVDTAEAEARIAVAKQQAARRQEELIVELIKPAEARRDAAVIEAEGISKAAMKTAEGQAKAKETQAAAEKVRLQAEGEGKALAEAASKRELGLAEAEVMEKKGLAEGAAIQAKLLAEALGLLKKQEALAQMSPAARTIIVLEMLPEIIAHAGDAGQKIVAAMFEQVGAGLARIDSVHMVDLGGGNGNGSGPVANFAMTIPKIVFGTLQQLRTLGIDVDGILNKLGVDTSDLLGVSRPATSAEPARVPESAGP